jgi:hypothetical protein
VTKIEIEQSPLGGNMAQMIEHLPSSARPQIQSPGQEGKEGKKGREKGKGRKKGK